MPANVFPSGLPAGTSCTVSLPAGSTLLVQGAGVATLGPGPNSAQPITLENVTTIGPFDIDRLVYLNATSAMGYRVNANTDQQPSVIARLYQTNQGYSIAQPDGVLVPTVPLTPVNWAGQRSPSVGRSMAEADRLFATRGRALTRYTTPTLNNGATIVSARQAGMFESTLNQFARLPGALGTGSRPSVIAPIFGTAAPSSGITSILVQVKAPLRPIPEQYVTFRVRLCSDSSGANWYGMTMLCPADGKEHWLMGTNFAAQQGTFVVGTSTITHVMVEDRNDRANLSYDGLQPGEVMFIGQVFLNPRGRAKAFIRFDDGPSTLFTTGTSFLADGVTQSWTSQTLLRRFGFRGNVALSAGRIGTTNPAVQWETWNGIRALYDDGWDMCVQSFSEPADNAQNGARLLGPLGFQQRAIASVDTAANTITAAGAHNFAPAGDYNPFPGEFIGPNLPAPLTERTLYYLRQTSATAFTVHTTLADGVTGANPVDITTTGNPATSFYRFFGSDGDDSAIYADYLACRQAIIANGVPGCDDVVCINQGAGDFYVATALRRFGARLVIGTTGSAGGANNIGARLALGESGDVRSAGTQAIGGPMLAGLGGCVQTDGTPTEAQVRQYVQTCVAAGAVFGNYHHSITASNGLVLAAYLDELRIQQNAGLVDVCTLSEIRDYLEAFAPLPVPTTQTAI